MRRAASRHLLTFVLVVVLVWYTTISPSSARFVRAPSSEPFDDLPRGPETPPDPSVPAGVREASHRARLPPDRRVVSEDLDWPEIIDD